MAPVERFRRLQRACGIFSLKRCLPNLSKKARARRRNAGLSRRSQKAGPVVVNPGSCVAIPIEISRAIYGARAQLNVPYASFQNYPFFITPSRADDPIRMGRPSRAVEPKEMSGALHPYHRVWTSPYAGADSPLAAGHDGTDDLRYAKADRRNFSPRRSD